MARGRQQRSFVSEVVALLVLKVLIGGLAIGGFMGWQHLNDRRDSGDNTPAYQTQYIEARAQIAVLNVAMYGLNAELTALYWQASQFRALNDNLTAQVGILENAIADIAAVIDANEGHAELIQTLTAQLVQMNSQLTEARAQIIINELMIANLETLLTTEQNTVAELMTQIDTLNLIIDGYITDGQQAQATITSLTSQVLTLSGQVTTLTNNNQNLTNQIASQAQLILEMQAEAEEMFVILMYLLEFYLTGGGAPATFDGSFIFGHAGIWGGYAGTTFIGSIEIQDNEVVGISFVSWLSNDFQVYSLEFGVCEDTHMMFVWFELYCANDDTHWFDKHFSFNTTGGGGLSWSSWYAGGGHWGTDVSLMSIVRGYFDYL